MSHDPNDIKNGELDQARLTAYALEQLEGAERAAVEALLAGSDRSRHTVEEIRALAAEVKKAAVQGALPPRSPELRVVLEQYLSNEEVAEMNAKPEPSSAEAPRHGRRRSTLIWAAAVCALVAAIPGYVLISGSLHQGFQPVALDAPAVTPASDPFAGAKAAGEFSYEEDEGQAVMVSSPMGDMDLAETAPAPADEMSRDGDDLLSLGKRDRFASGSSAPASGEKARTVTTERLVERPSEAASAGSPAAPKTMTTYHQSLRFAGQEGAAPGIPAKKAAPTPLSESEYGLQTPQPGGYASGGHAIAPKSTVPKPADTPALGVHVSPTNEPQSRAAGEGPAATPGMGGGMMGGVAGKGGMPADEFGTEMGLKDAKLSEAREMDPTSTSLGQTRGEAEASEQSGQSLYAISEKKAPAGSRTTPLDLQTRKPASAAPQSAVAVELVDDLDVIILKGKAKEVESVTRIIEETERLSVEREDEERSLLVHGRPLIRRRVPGTEEYDPIVENPFLSAADNPESTFSVDVDSASYANVRRFLDSGRLPPPNAVRIEELVNYFRYDYPQPDDEVPFSVNMETAQCPWDTEHRLVRIGLKGREIDPEQRGPSNLVFLLDVSGSMRDENKLPLVQYAMNMLVDQLTEDDRVAIVTYAGDAGVALDSTSGEKRKKIRRAVDNLSAGGSTHGSAGIVMAYDQAMQHFVKNGTNRVILCTDGDLNVGVTSDDELVQLIGEQAKSGVFLTVLGFGTGNLKDSKMEKLADKGNGIYAYVDGRREARRVLVEQMAGSLVTIAKDVKIQIEFNPAEVKSYRLIGYENRIMAAEDFANDKKDAGEIGAGHTVTALYEIVPGGSDSGGELGRELKYQRKTGRELTEAATSGELLTLKLRYKEPEGKESKLLELVQKDSDKRFGQASADFRFASSVAAFGMLLRGSQHAGDLTWSAAEEFAAGSLGEDPGGYRNEFLELIHRAGELRSR